MRLVLDTNVIISGIYFSGPPYDILDAWRRGRNELVVSAEILDEYRRVGEQLAKQFSGVQVEAFLELLILRARIVNAPPLKEKVCSRMVKKLMRPCGSEISTVRPIFPEFESIGSPFLAHQ